MTEESPKYWNTLEGKIVRTLVQKNNTASWTQLLEENQLDEKQLREGLKNLFQKHAIKKDHYGNYFLVDERLESECRDCLGQLIFDEQNIGQNQQAKLPQDYQLEQVNEQETIFNWLNTWKSMKNLDIPLQNKHFFLDGVYIDELTKDMIKLSNDIVLIANPFIESCYLTEAILQARERGKTVKIVTRPPTKNSRFATKTECHLELTNRGVLMKYNSQIHAKIVAVDNRIAIVSSMNFYSGSSGGASLEAGMVSIDQKVVDAASKYIEKLFERPDLKEQIPNLTIQANHTSAPDITQAKHKPARAGKRWTSEEDEQLKNEYQEGMSISQLTKKHERKYGAIRARLARLGLIEDFHFFPKRKSNS